MEIDPLKIPAFMRKKTIRKRTTSSYLRASEAPSPTKFPKARRQPIFTPTPSMTIKPKRVKREPVLMPVGVVTHYLDKIKVAIIKLGADLEVGAKLQLAGTNGPFKQKLSSMQIDRKNVENASRGQEIGIKVNKKVAIGELVYLID